MKLIGRVLSDRYEILEKIGEGGMAYVYKAKGRLLNRYVAIKVLKSEYSKDDTFVKRFKAEAQSAASLTHANIVSVYDVGEEDGINYIVMELLENKTLKDYVEEKGALPEEEILKISTQIASALEAAHKENIIHRDIKPQNIVLTKDLIAKVTDFGIAKVASSATITNFGSTMGSVHYFSPEHAKGGYTDEKSDIYSLGVVMYEMATGRVPFNSDSPVSVALKHIQEAPVAPIDINGEISKSLNNIILKAMTKNTANRYKNATEMLKDINEVVNNSRNSVNISSSIEAGVTQVIPVITDEIIEENIVPNIRTRNARRMNVVNSKGLKLESKLENKEKSEKKLEEKLNSKPSKNRKKLIIIAVVITLIVLAVISFFAIKITNKINEDNKPAEEYIVPNLVGRNLEEVQKEYLNQDIEIIVDKMQYDLDVAEGLVISQTPNKDISTSDRKIYVVVSKGQKMVSVPDVTGKDIKVVKYELEDTLGFVIEQEEEISDTVLANIIISQEPEEGSELAYGSTIKIKVSQGDGKEKIIMPSVIGKTEEEAKEILTNLKLNVQIKEAADESKDNHIVISQSYPQNQELKEGDLVEIAINKLLVSKEITLDLTKLKGDTEYEDDIEVKVTASVDGSASNTVFNKSFELTDVETSFTLNGYTSADLIVYIDDMQVKTLTVDFTE